ncbi:MAG TPA: SusC/RagA family TonB-linked outer membrane protein [Gemmatimonadaceae bacterium]|nr:SusC/RagA family TonB-linked outer membrane protein [Gemmatimonadaceae bacterium]
MAVARKFSIWTIAAVAILLTAYTRVSAQGQTGTISGVVVDSASRQPLAGVSIIVGDVRTRTSPDGGFTMTGITAGDRTIRAIFIGYAATTRTINVATGATARITIEMAARAVALSEMVVTGYGQQRAASLTGSVQSVSSDEFNAGRVVSPEQLIAGKVPGVQIVDTGEPGGGISIRIRGGSSVTSSNEPLFVVDGVPLVVGGGLSAGRNPLNFLNPSDIENITVLKDASATAIFGSRGANGVVMIETKRGKQGSHMTYTGSVSSSQVVKTADILSVDQFRAAITANAPENVSKLGNTSTDWTDLIEQSAIGQEHNLAFSGGAGTGRYRISAGYLDQKGVIEASKTRRMSGAVNYDQNLFRDRLSIRANLKGSRTDDRFTPGGVVGSAYAFAPTQPVTDPTGANGGFYEWVDPLSPTNPVALLALNSDKGRTDRSVGDIEAKYQIPAIQDLFATLRLGYDVIDVERNLFSPGSLRPAAQARIEKRNNSFSSPLLDAFLNYARPLGGSNSNLDLTAGYSWQQTHADNASFVASGLASDLLGPNGVPTANKTETFLDIQESKLASFFARMNYSMNDTYFLTLAVRKDGSSRFGENHQWGTFPSAAVAWRLGNRAVLDAVPGLSELKFRASWGQNGNQEFGNYRAFSDYVIGDAFSQAQFGNTYVPTIRPSAADPGIKWEQTSSTNLGFDYGFLQNRVNGSIDYYWKKTDDLIFNVPVAAGTNLSNFVTTNIGSLKNQGLELNLNAQVLQAGKNGLNWNTNWNASTNTNKLVRVNSVGTGDEKIQVGGIQGGVGVNIEVLQPGHPINSFFVYRHKMENGLPIYKDTNNDGTINENDLYIDQNGDGNINQDDRVAFHSPAPKWILGHTSYATWRDLDFGFTLRANLGNYVYNNVASSQGFYSALKGATPNNLHASVLKTNFVNPQYFSDYYVEDASFLRLDNLSVGYTLHSARVPDGTRIFGAAQNLFTITKYSGVDPLAGINGIDNNIYPRARTFTAGVTVGF